MPAVLLPESLRAQLPLLGAQRRVLEPMVYTRFWVPDGAWQFYVTEGEPDGTDYRFYGLLMASEHEMDWSWREVRLSDLMRVSASYSIPSSPQVPFRMRFRIHTAISPRASSVNHDPGFVSV